MKISNNLPQFENETVLIVVSGKQDAIFYLAKNGELFKVESFKVDRPKYDDVQGHFETSAKTGKHGQTMRAGSPFDPTHMEEKAVTQYLQKLQEELEGVQQHHNITQLFIFAPSYVKHEVEKRMPYALQDKKQLMIEGNYYEEHPFELLERIQKKQHKEPVRPIKEAARKILDKFKNS